MPYETIPPKLHSTRVGVSKAPGLVVQQLHWEPREERTWMAVQFVGLVVLYAARFTLPVSIVSMAEELRWDKRQCGIVLSSFFWGYILTQVVGGHLADRFGGDRVQWMAGVVWGSCTLALAYVSSVSLWLVVFLRCLSGIAQGVHYPSLSSLIGHKVPDNNRTNFWGTANSGSPLGVALLGFFGSLILSSYGWKSLFVLVGSFSLLWAFCLRCFSVSSHHRTHYKLSDSGFSAAVAKSHSPRLKLHVQPSTFMAHCGAVPWRELLRQAPVIALLFAHFSLCFYLHILSSWAPTYFNEQFPERRDNSWLYNTAPYLFMAAGSYTSGLLAAGLTWLEYSLTHIRKITLSIGLLLSSFSLLIIACLGRGNDNFSAILFLIGLASFGWGQGSSCTGVNSSDLAPAFSGALFGVMNTIGCIPGILAVSMVGYVLHATGNWTVVFLAVSVILLMGLLVYLAFGSSHTLQLLTPVPH